MAEESTSDSPQSTDVPQTTVQSTAPAPQQTTQHVRTEGPGQQILDALNALPERLVQSMREAFPAQRQSQPSQSTQDAAAKAATATATKTVQQDAEKHKEPGKKSFAEWWFHG